MNVILALSLILRLAGALLSLVYLWRWRDWRLGFLTVMLLLMALRSFLSLVEASEFSRGIEYIVEGPGLAVSMLALLGVAALAKILEEREANLAKLRELNHNLQADIAARKQIEHRLEESEALYRTLLDNIPDGVVLINPEGVITACNRSVSKMMGAPERDIVGTSLRTSHVIREDGSDFPHEEFPALVTLRTGETRSGVIMGLRDRVGNLVWVSVNSAPLFHPAEKRLNAVVASFYDITDFKRAQAALAASERSLRAIFEAEPECVKILGHDGALLNMNPAGLAMIEADSLTQVQGQYLFGLVESANRDAFIELHRRASQGQTGRMEYEIVGLRGTRRWLETHVVPFPLEDKDAVGALGITRDITARKSAEAEIVEWKNRYEAAIQASGQILYDWNPYTNYVTFGGNTEKMLGYRVDELNGGLAHWLNFVHPEDRPTFEMEIDRVRATGMPFHKQYRVRRKNGTYIIAQDDGYFFKDKDDNLRSMVGFLFDVTEQKAAERERERLYQQLQESRERLARLSRQLIFAQEKERRHLARELHDEIGQILTAVTINLQQVRTLASIPLPRLEDSIQIVNHAIQEVRDLSLNLRPAMLDDFGLAVALRWYLDKQKERLGAEIHFEATSGVRPSPEHEAAAFRVAQEALTNIARYAHAKNVWVELHQMEEGLEMSIRDDGVGFDVAEVRRGAVHGKSIGILGMQERVELLGGEIDIQSQPGQGTTIRFRLGNTAPVEEEAVP